MTIKSKKLTVTDGKCIFPLTNLRGDYACTIKYSGDAHYKGAKEDDYYLKVTPTTKKSNLASTGEWGSQYFTDATNPVDPTFSTDNIKSGVFSKVIHKTPTHDNSKYTCEITVNQEGTNKGFVLGLFYPKKVDTKTRWMYTCYIGSTELGNYFKSGDSQQVDITNIEELFPVGEKTKVIFDILARNSGNDCYVSITIGDTTFENILLFDEAHDMRFGFMSTAPEDKQLVFHSLTYTEWNAEEQ